MRTSGLGLSIFLVAVGAILAWATSYELSGIDLQMVGLILFVIGVIGALLTVLTSVSSNRREVVVEERQVR